MGICKFPYLDYPKVRRLLLSCLIIRINLFEKRRQRNVVRFQDLPPGEVYARLIIDDNEDGLWTTGNYEELRQPEKVYYYPDKFVIRAYSDHLEEWNLHAVTEIKQKPLEITINKPKEKSVEIQMKRGNNNSNKIVKVHQCKV